MKNPIFNYLPIFIALIFFACSNPGEGAWELSKNKKATSENQSKQKETMSDQNQAPGFIHTVFFWLKEDATEADHAAFLKDLGTMLKIETIEFATIGKPANTPREVVDNSYDYAWVAHFKNAADQDAYQIDPIHLAFVDAQSHIWTRVQVYDTLPLEF